MDNRLELTAAVAAEVERAVSELPERQRQVLELREARGLSYEQIAVAIGGEAADVAPLLAHARLSLREQRRGTSIGDDCPDRDRALRALARRQDGEPPGGGGDDWLLAHLGECPQCSAAHAAMLEASHCYRAAARSGESG